MFFYFSPPVSCRFVCPRENVFHLASAEMRRCLNLEWAIFGPAGHFAVTHVGRAVCERSPGGAGGRLFFKKRHRLKKPVTYRW